MYKYNIMGPIEKYLNGLESKRTLKEDSITISPKVQAFLDECDRLSKILQDDELFEKEKEKQKSKHIK
jgi:hypothetical protein